MTALFYAKQILDVGFFAVLQKCRGQNTENGTVAALITDPDE
jgi:hypothetical protein